MPQSQTWFLFSNGAKKKYSVINKTIRGRTSDDITSLLQLDSLPIMGLSSWCCTDWLDDAWETPLVSVLKMLLLRALLARLFDMWGGILRLTPPTRSRRRSFGMSNGRSPRSTDVALPDAPEFLISLRE